MRTGIPFSIAFASVLLFAGQAHAQDTYDLPWEKFAISVGGFATESDTTVQINSELGVGAVVDLENALGVERSFQTYRIDAKWRLGERRRHEIELHYFDSKRTGAKKLNQEIEIGDQVFPIDAEVSTEWNLEFINLDYVYNFLMDDRVRLGVSAGLHTTGIGLKVEEVGGAKVEEDEFTAPLPMLGLRSEVILAPGWRLRMDLNFFYLEYEEFTGSLSDTYVGVEWLPWKNFGFGLGINHINYDVEADGDSKLGDINGSIEFQMSGLLLYGKYQF
jgi:hypothetical protein